MNQSISWVRSEERRKRREKAWAEENAGRSRGDDNMSDETLKKAILALPDELRVPVILHYQEGFKYREIAAVCKCPAGTVAKRLSTAKARLKAELVKGGAVALALSIEKSLRGQPAISPPPGLEERLCESAAREASRLGTVASGAAASVGKALLVKLGVAIGCAALLVTGSWFGIQRAVDRSAPPAAGVAAAARGVPSPPEHAKVVHGAPGASRRSGDDSPLEASKSDGVAEDAVPEPAAAEAVGPVVYGWVRDAAGRPVPNARVCFADSPAGDAVGESVTTDEEGYYELDWGKAQAAPAMARAFLGVTGTADLKLLRSWIAKDEVVLQEAAVNTLDLEVARSLKMQVLSEAAAAQFATSSQGEPLNVAFSTVGESLYTYHAGRATRTCTGCHSASPAAEGAAGQGGSPCAAAGAATHVRATLEGYEPALSPPIDLQTFDQLQVDLLLEQARPISGVVVDEKGREIAGADVTVAAYSGAERVPAESLAVKADEDGAFRFSSLPPGVYVLRAALDGTCLPAETIARTGDSALRLCLRQAGSVRVEVVSRETGEPLAGYRVEAHDTIGVAASSSTDEAGVAVLGGLRSGRYVFNTFRDSSSSQYSRGTAQASVLAGHEASVRIEVGGRADIAGLVTGLGYDSAEDGLVVQVVPQSAVPRSSTERKQGIVQPDGSFTVKNIPPGDYWLVFGRAKGDGSVEPLSLQELTVAPGARIVRAAVSAEPLEPSWVDVTVADEAGRLIEGASVELELDGIAQTVSKGLTDSSGRVSLSVLPARYSILAAAPGGEQGVVREVDARTRERQSLRIVIARRPPQGPLADQFAQECPMTLRAPVSLRAFCDLARQLGCLDAALSADLEHDGVVQRIQTEHAGRGQAPAILEATLKSAGLRWSPAGNGILIERAGAEAP